MPLPLYDMHTHSRHSFDGDETIDNLCKAALDKGLAGIAITDHVDFGPYLTVDWQARLAASVNDAKTASHSYSGALDVLCGIELGQPLQDREKADETLLQCEFDVVVMGLHNAAARQDYYFLNYTESEVDSLLAEYFSELYQMACWRGFDVMAHLGYPLRYINKALDTRWRLDRHADIIDAILTELATAGKALEINTAGLNRGGGEATADLAQLRRFRELGGQFVTLGSDAHAARYVGGCFDAGIEMLRAAGFGYVAHYKGRKPILTQI